MRRINFGRNSSNQQQPVVRACLAIAAFMVAWFLPLSNAAHARVLWVGDSGSCEYHTIAEAISAAGSSPDPDEVRITKDHPLGEWHAQALTISDQVITVGGNWEYCGQPDADYSIGYGVLSGFGGEQAPVIRVRGSSRIRLYGLAIALGDPRGGANEGGGIDFRGEGELHLDSVELRFNAGQLGGAVYAECLSCGATPLVVTLGANVYVHDNEADTGGGLYLGIGTKLTMKSAETRFHRNRAERGDGGAIFLGYNATAEIGSPDPGDGTGVFYRNSAMGSGGAIYVRSYQGFPADSPVDLYSISAESPLSFVENAAVHGAAIAVSNGNTQQAIEVCATHAQFRGNRTFGPIDASGIIHTSGAGASFSVNSEECLARLPDEGRIACGALDQSRCDEFSSNVSSTGALFRAGAGSRIFVRRARIDQNSAQQVLYADSPDFATEAASLSLIDSVVDHNTLQIAVARSGFDALVTLVHVTVADNIIELGRSILNNQGAGQLFVQNSILDQSEPLLVGHADVAALTGVLARNLDGYAFGTGNLVGIPSFIPGFYRLQPYSEGIDRVVVTPGLTDPDGTPRSIDNVNANNIPGYYADIGAYESTATAIPPGADTIFSSSFE